MYHKVGTTLDDDFLILDKVTRLAVTGKVSGDFTMKLNKAATGNQATTGIVISEVDSTNNAGVYHVQVNSSTGFVASTGEYTLTLYLTADPTYRWARTYRITADGTGEGSTGTASFTATASDGRVTDGTSALADATIRIRNASNVIVVQTTTDASGLWGPIYLPAGTYTIDTQKSGYSSSTSKTITVVGTTATGPLTDVAITAASSGSGLTCSTLTAYARRVIYDKVGNKSDTEILDSLNEAIDMISMERQWPWYLTHGDFNLQAAYMTGTIALTALSTTCTLTTGTWPSWAASGKLKINGKVYRIASRTSGTVVVLADAWQETSASGVTYVLYQDEYSLPSDCMQVAKLFPGETWGMSQTPCSFEHVMDAYARSNFGQEYPQVWAPYRAKIIVWPYPQSAKDLPFLYYRKPTWLVTGSDEADWDPMHVNLLHRAIEHCLAMRYPTVAGDPKATYGAYQLALSKAIPNDKGTMHLPSPLAGQQQRSRLRPIPAS
jgi:hypothetical protein